MKKIINSKSFSSEKGFTGADIVISVIIFILFAGVIASLMYMSYKNSISIQKGAYAGAIATVILEKTDEKPYEEINNNFLNSNQSEIDIPEGYNVTYESSELYYNLIKQVKVTVTYSLEGQNQSIIISKLKIKE